ncbi:hypothetical protein EPH_0057670 [Eimeria praecox]|uniref:Transmembrane protein n=1 Tax=Eimeria praecox TaxID=51316 RepID=U6H5B8_9EIME|nr:hypothetical protein EPH_0057670 [Eimeria praecox]
MASAVFREECLTHEHELRDAPRYASTQPTTNHYIWEDAAQGASGGPDESDSGHCFVKGCGRRWPGGFRGGICWVLLFMFIPALIISVLRTICKASSSGSNVREPERSPRRLSDGEETSQAYSTPGNLEEVCAAMEADVVQSVPQGSNSHHALDAAEHVARIAFALSQEALAFEIEKQQTQPALQSSLPPLLAYPASFGMLCQHQHLEGETRMTGEQPAAVDELHLLPGIITAEHEPGSLPPEFLASSLLPVGGASQHVLTGSQLDFESPSPFRWFQQGVPPHAGGAPPQFVTGSQFVERLQRLAAAPCSVGLLPHAAAPLLPQDPLWDRSRKKRRIELSEGVYPALDPDSWLDAVPMIENSPDGLRQSQPSSPQGLSSEQTAPALRATCQAPAGKGKPRAACQSPLAVSTSCAGGASRATAPADAAGDSSTAVSAPAATGNPIAATAAAETSVAGEAPAALVVAVASGDPPAAAAAATGAAGEPSGAVGKEVAAGEVSTEATVAPGAGEASSRAAPVPENAAADVEASWIRTHPYVSLPALREGVVPPRIHLSASNFVTGSGSSVHGTLLCIRCLFMKQALDRTEAASLAGYVKELAIASAAQARAATRMSRPIHGVANIGQQFLFLDAIVSALHVLGVSPPSCTWWAPFTDCFDTNYRYEETEARTQHIGRANIDLANRMLAAMSICKTGTRPDLDEIIYLKRNLFFSAFSPLGFRSPRVILACSVSRDARTVDERDGHQDSPGQRTFQSKYGKSPLAA